MRASLPASASTKYSGCSLPSRRNCSHVTRAAETGAQVAQGDGGDGVGGTGGNGNDHSKRVGEDDDDRYLGMDEAIALAAAAGTTLPKDFLAVASSEGIKLSAVQSYIELQNRFLAGLLARTAPWFRDRLIYDHRFLFKVGAEVTIDSACATVAEVRKRGDEFWDEFEFYVSDLLVGLVMDVVLVGLMAPVAVLGKARKKSKSGVLLLYTMWCSDTEAIASLQEAYRGCFVEPLTDGLKQLLDKVPSAVFEKNIPGVREYGIGARLGCIGVKFLEYSLAGMFCGLVGQSIANAAMQARRAQYPDAEYSVEPPPLVGTALVWGLFMGVSSNLRYQAVFGLERLVDVTVAKRLPQIAYGTTILIRFVNNVIGGENFVDMARFFGIQ